MIKVNVIDKGFNKKINHAVGVFRDMSEFFNEISSDWHRTNDVELFKGRSGPGRYKDLNEKYKEQKREKAGFVYPVLKGENERIFDGLTKKTSPYSVNEVKKDSLVMGVKDIPYAETHQKGLRVRTRHGSFKMPERPFIFNEETGTKNFHLMINRWKKLFTYYYQRKLGGRTA